MSTGKYTIPLPDTRWSVDSNFQTVFAWDYDAGRERLQKLYERGKEMQWDGADRLDWSHAVDPDNPLGVPDEYVTIYGSDIWERMSDRHKAEARHHMASWQFSQFLHGEQGALICSARIVETVPDMDSKFYAGTQVMDEARHVEVYSRFVREKLNVAYPINPHLKTLLDQVISDRRWDMTYLGMQIVVEGLALAAFGMMRDLAGDKLARALTAYVMQDEARHVAFGRLALRDVYPQLTQAERDEREEFVVEACYLMRDRFVGEEMWQNLSLPVKECTAYVEGSMVMREYRKLLFSRIVPTIKDIGLWGPRVRRAYEDMGVMAFADVNPDDLMAADEAAAQRFDAEREKGAA
jgi:hypothetical protein